MAATLADLVADTGSLKRFVVRFKTWNPTTTQEETHYYSDHGLATRPEESPPNTLFDARLLRPLTFARSMFSGTNLGGRAVPDFGEIILTNKDDSLDFLLMREADGRDCDVFIGGETDIWTNFFQIFRGTIVAIEGDEETISIRVQSPAFKLDRVVHQAIYGDAAEDDIEGKPIPEAHGQVLNVTPVLIDSTGFVFQVHNGQIEAIVNVYDEGVVKTVTSDYTVDLNAGTIAFVAAPAGRVTVDLQGSKEGGVYNTKVGDIVQRISGYRGITDFDTAAFSAFNTAFPATVGVYVSEPTNTLDILDFLVGSAGGFYGFTRTGEMTIGQLTGPGAARTLLGANMIRNIQPAGVERCNAIRNSTMVGATLSPDMHPTNWASDANWTAIDDVTALGVENDLDYIETRLNGTPGGAMTLYFDTITAITARESHIWSTSAYLKLQAGTLTNIDSIVLGFAEYDTTPTQLAEAVSGSLSVTGTSTRFQFSDKLDFDDSRTARPFLRLNWTSGAIDLTLRIAAPQFERGRLATSFIPTSTVAVCAPIEDGADTGATIPPAVPTISRALVFTRGGESSSGTPSPSVNTYMHRTPSLQGNRRTMTFSTWFRRHNIHSDNEYLWWTIAGGAPTFDLDSFIGFIADTNKIRVAFRTLPTFHRVDTTTAFTREDVWTHLCVAIDTTQAVATDRVKIWVNSVAEALIESASGLPTQNFDTHFNRTAAHFLGRREFDVDHLNAVLADTYWVDGLALTPADFTTWTGQAWVPKTYAGAMGTNGFHLDYQDNSTVAALGNDVSAAANDLSVVNFLTTDQTSSDLPTSPVTVI